MLMEQVEPAGLRISAETERTPELDQRARRIVTQVGTSIGREVAQISEDLEALSALFVPIGLQAEMPPARTASADCPAGGRRERPVDMGRASFRMTAARTWPSSLSPFRAGDRDLRRDDR